MTLLGTIVNGEIKLDQPANLPEGTRVTVLLGADEDDFGPLPAASESHAEFMASLRESIAETAAGVRGRSVDDVFDDLDRELRTIGKDKE